MIRMLLIVLSLLFLSGCSPSEYENISDNPKYSGLVGLKLEFLEGMYIHGVSMEESSGEVIDVYVITGKPGFSGREVLSKDSLSVGTIVLVEKVLECKSCLYDDIKYEVKFIDLAGAEEKIIYLSDIGNKYLTKIENDAITFNPSLFDVSD